MADDGHQLIISTMGDLISARRVTVGSRSIQWLGQMSDTSLQQLSKDQDTSERGGQASFEAGTHFENRHGTRRKLSQKWTLVIRGFLHGRTTLFITKDHLSGKHYEWKNMEVIFVQVFSTQYIKSTTTSLCLFCPSQRGISLERRIGGLKWIKWLQLIVIV
jgi:hypothetical protein